MTTRTIRLPDEPVVSNDPEVQEALERICIETMATYRLVAVCWILVRDVMLVRELCKQRSLGLSEHGCICEAIKISDILEA